MLTLQVIASLGWTLEVADAKNAFCQSDPLERPKGAIFCEPCEGIGLDSGDLIEIIAPVYGLNDAPLLWHRTLTTALTDLGFRKSLLEPCLWVKRDDSRRLEALVLIEVDDLIISAQPRTHDAMKEQFQKRFKFG